LHFGHSSHFAHSVHSVIYSPYICTYLYICIQYFSSFLSLGPGPLGNECLNLEISKDDFFLPVIFCRIFRLCTLIHVGLGLVLIVSVIFFMYGTLKSLSDTLTVGRY
jgi:hypothetical protein